MGGKEAEAAQNPPGAEAPTDKADADAKKAAKPNKKAESAGLSQAEKKELDQIKNDIVSRKTKLKEKECPGSTQKPDKKEEKKKKLLGSSMQKQEDSLRQEIDAYKTKLKSEFGYSNKDIK